MSVTAQGPSILAGPSISTGAFAAQTEAQPLSFIESMREKQIEWLGVRDLVPLSPQAETLIDGILHFWQVGSNVHFFDLLSMDILNDLQVLCPRDQTLKDEFLELYPNLITLADRETLEKGLFRQPSTEVTKLLEFDLNQLDKFKKGLQQRIFKTLTGQAPPHILKKIQGISNKVGLLVNFLKDPVSREFFHRYSLDFYLKERAQTSNEHLAKYIHFLHLLNPDFPLKVDAADIGRLPPDQIYQKILQTNEICFEIAGKLGLQIRTKREAGESFSKEMTTLASADVMKRRVAGLKTHFERLHLKKDPHSTQTRALDNIQLFNALKEKPKGHFHSEYQKILTRALQNLGDRFDPVMIKLLTTSNVEAVIRTLPTFDAFPEIMRQIKKEIKALHSQAMMEASELGEKARESYLQCFQTLLSLFIVLHDLNALRNAHHHQVGNNNLPPDLLDYVDLDVRPDDSSDDDTESALPAAGPSVRMDPAPALPAPAAGPSVMLDSAPALPVVPKQLRLDEYKGPSLRLSTRKTLDTIHPRPRKEKEFLPLPSEGAKWHKAIRPILSYGFYLERQTDHQYYRNSRHPEIWIKISPHGTLSPGALQAIKKSLVNVEALDKEIAD